MAGHPCKRGCGGLSASPHPEGPSGEAGNVLVHDQAEADTEGLSDGHPAPPSRAFRSKRGHPVGIAVLRNRQTSSILPVHLDG